MAGGVPVSVSRRAARGPTAWISLLVLVAGCVSGSLDVPEDDPRERFDLRPLGEVPTPPGDVAGPDRIALGRLLFFDPILGGERDVACGTCHHPDFHFADGRPLGAGVSGVGLGPARTLSVSSVTGDPIPDAPRNTQTVYNAAFAADVEGNPSHLAPLFWDGRAQGLEGQALQPLVSREEMRGDAFPGTDREAAAVALDSIMERLRGIPAYVERFRLAFPDDPSSEPDGRDLVNGGTVARALAAYQRELVTRNSPFDRFVAGDDDALDARQLAGLELFFTRAKCFVCHRGPMFSNYQFMVTGVPTAGPGMAVIPGDDTGREESTGRAADRYAFRVPTLRNVELTAPYMHAGVFATLDEVVRFYDGGAEPRHPNVDEAMLEVVMREPLGLTDDEIASLVAFLRALSDPGSLLDPTLRAVPAAVPSGLPPVLGVAARSPR